MQLSEFRQEDELQAMRRQILTMATIAGEGHIPSALSILDIVHVLFSKFISADADSSNYNSGSRFVLSKGHGSLALYVTLANAAILEKDHLETFCRFESILGGHPDRTKVPGVEASTGSLGHGLPMAVGLALSQKIKGQTSRTYVLVGDGECNEGTTWESAMLAGHHLLGNLTCIIDHNHSTDRALRIDPLVMKFESFGWEALEVDGHNADELERALRTKSMKPIAIIARTTKGHGVREMENNPAWHHGAPNSDEFRSMIESMQ